MAGNTESRASNLMQVEAARVEAMLCKDYVVLERILADDLSYCHSSGRWDTKAGFINNLKSGFCYLSSKRTGSTVRFFGDTAVVTGSLDIVMQPNASAQSILVACNVTQAWVELADSWQLVAHQATRRPVE